MTNNGITIAPALRAYRRRALETQACIGSHAWRPGWWDGETDAESYCLDAPDVVPAGSTILLFDSAVPRMVLREPAGHY